VSEAFPKPLTDEDVRAADVDIAAAARVRREPA
jgi:hypothetical protein